MLQTMRTELEARVTQIVNSGGGMHNLPVDTRETIVRRVLPKLISGAEGREDQRGTSDEAYSRYARRLARNIAKELLRQDPNLLRSLIEIDQPLMFPAAVSDLPLDHTRIARFQRRFLRLSYRDRFLLKLVVIEEQTIGQIADQLKVSFGDATTRVFRLFARLKP
jgi:DNA-directed RNA polymerase specialized sigma24 family protein